MVAGDLSALRFNRDEYLSLITTSSPARDDDVGGQHTVIPGSKLTRTMPRTTVISTAAKQSGEISLRNVASPWWQEISRLCVSLEPKVLATHTGAFLRSR